MVTEKFVKNLNALITKQLREGLRGPPAVITTGEDKDQYEGLLRDMLGRASFRRRSYQAEEYLLVKIPVSGRHFDTLYFTCPIINMRKKSLQSVGLFMAKIPYPTPETFIDDIAVRFSRRMVPHDMLMKQGIKAKNVIKENMIRYQPVNQINEDKRLLKILFGKSDCKVRMGLVMDDTYVVRFKPAEVINGFFSIVPFHGETLLIARDAGSSGAMANSPKFPFDKRYQSMDQVAELISKNPQTGQKVGALYPDNLIAMVLADMFPDKGPEQ